MAKRKIYSIKEQRKVDWKGGFNAFKYLPRFFKEIYASGRLIFSANLFARLVNSFTPVIILYIGKLLIDEVILQAKLGDDKNLDRLINLTDGLLGDLYSNYSSIAIIKKTKDLSISQLEDSEIYDKLERARTKTSSRVGLMSNILAQFQSLIIAGSLIAGLIFFECC